MAVRIIEINENEIKFNNGIVITYEHDQDCCENVYCDFLSLKDTIIMDFSFDNIYIEPVKDSGFRLNTIFIPCYNKQNGYYSDNLKLIIDYKNGKKVVYNLQEMECIKNEID